MLSDVRAGACIVLLFMASACRHAERPLEQTREDAASVLPPVSMALPETPGEAPSVATPAAPATPPVPATSDAGEVTDPRSASTRASSGDGSFTIAGLDGAARHLHGGAPARLSMARFKITNRSRLRAASRPPRWNS